MPTTVNITGTDPGSYVEPVLAPAVGTVETSLQMQILSQGICNQTKHLNNIVTDGTYAITCLDVQATTLHASGGTVASVTGVAAGNGTGTKGTGSGSGSGATGQGGATGAGVIGTGGATSGVGVAGVGGPSSAGVTGTGGASGPGVKGVGGSSNVGIECGAGNMRFTGTQPVKTADPGFDNYACGTNQAKSWSLVDLNSGTITITDGYNTASLAFSGSYIQVTFARAITNPVVHATLSTIAVPMFTVVSSTVVQIGMYTVTAGAFAQVNLSSTTATLGISVFGRQ